MIYEAILLGQPYENTEEIWVPIMYQDIPVLTPEMIKNIFGGKASIYGLEKERDYFKLSGFELRNFLRDNNMDSRVSSMYVYTMPGVIRILSKGCNSIGVELILAALNLTYYYSSDIGQLRLAFFTFCSVHNADMKLIESRIQKIENNRSLVSVDNSTDIIPIDSTPWWRDDEGFIHVNSINRHVMGYWSMSEVAAKLNLYSESSLPHTQLAEDICYVVLRIGKHAESPNEKYWATFKYSHYDSGKRHDKNCLRLTDEGLNLVQDWWFRNASKYAFEEKKRHGYNFSKKFAIHPDIPLMASYREMVNPVVGNVNDSGIIDAEVQEI